jgi:carbamoyl-phosphate synthase large subunit
MRMQEILMQESPDLILCCRDDDTLPLSQLKHQHPDLPGVLPVGSPQAALIGLDKWQTWLFARKHGLPFADSFMLGESGDEAALEAFCQRVGYPVVAKPARGAGSRGVYFVRHADDAQVVAQEPGYLFQEYVGDPRDLERYFASLRGPPPLFAQLPAAGYHVSHAIISPAGDLVTMLVTENQTTFGHTSSNRRVVDPVLDSIVADYVRAFSQEGGMGPMNVQFRRKSSGSWRALEINLRTSSMLSRLLMGVDELYQIISAFVPDVSFPELHFDETETCDLVRMHFYCHPVFNSQVSTLKRMGNWSRA